MESPRRRGRTGMAFAGVALSLVLTTTRETGGEGGDAGPVIAEVVITESLGSLRNFARFFFLLASATSE
ncbi:hypothetical protein [Amycolatopsis magusensis]|uniref:Uncharacterized protein n=1 Tax=Amycolatopsis magusensis TaxID=882444 RepID=A0ABS4PY12_9PSEU|nr:hypothetical protein [Amycolatopsis magusensis]MBP2184322.1 hypothetical protein [Amycolatopsis magusensis]MDI5978152.1 hypothetical protein [Amycolatopsis magusensis]